MGSLLWWDHGGSLLLSELSAVWCILYPTTQVHTYLNPSSFHLSMVFLHPMHPCKWTFLHRSVKICAVKLSVKCKHPASQADSPATEAYAHNIRWSFVFCLAPYTMTTRICYSICLALRMKAYLYADNIENLSRNEKCVIVLTFYPSACGFDICIKYKSFSSEKNLILQNLVLSY